MISKNQTDLSDQGTFFSLVVIYLLNLIVLSVMLVIASPEITFAGFGSDILTNIGNFSHTVVTLAERFSRGAQYRCRLGLTNQRLVVDRERKLGRDIASSLDSASDRSHLIGRCEKISFIFSIGNESGNCHRRVLPSFPRWWKTETR